jgi:aryl-alcohol dehydrogenase-like predicted oxidoreductase
VTISGGVSAWHKLDFVCRLLLECCAKSITVSPILQNKAALFVHSELLNIGKTNVKVAPIGVGTWSWGDRGDWGYGKSHIKSDVISAFETATSCGQNLFDTAEKYANGESERLLGELIRTTGRRVVVATKFSPSRWKIRRHDLFTSLKKSLQRLDLRQVDLYQVHWPTRLPTVESRMDALAATVKEGLVKAIGVSNYNLDQLRRAHDELARKGVPLASIQLEFSLLHRDAETNGILNECRQRSIMLIAYSPLSMGVLTGKYTPQSPPEGLRGKKFSGEFLTIVQPILSLLKEIGQAHQERTITQVALNWLVCKGVVPIPGAKNALQAEENAGGMGWELTQEEIVALDHASDRLQLSQ